MLYALVFFFLLFLRCDAGSSWETAIVLDNYTVTAGNPVKGRIVGTQLYDATYSGRLIASIQVYLAAEASSSRSSTLGGSALKSQCTLLKRIPLCNNGIEIADNHISLVNASFTFTVPKDVGPSGSHYSLHAQIFLTNGNTYSGEISSQEITLTGAGGHWAKQKLEDRMPWKASYFPCSSFSCVTACADSAPAGSGNDTTAYQSCVKKCPGVEYPSSNSTTAAAVGVNTTAPACLLKSASTSKTSAAANASNTSDGATSLPPSQLIITGILLSLTSIVLSIL